MATSQIEMIYSQIKPLNFDDKQRLLEWLAKDLKPTASQVESTGLVYGKYQNTSGRMSTEEDFKIAEWNPTEAQLNGE